MKNIILLSILIPFLFVSDAIAFCGFYVAKADADLFNKSSEVIISRQDKHTVITMSNDYSGDIKDFAMVVPVPQILQEEDIRVVEHIIFDKLDAYSGPRLVEYHDRNPCAPVYDMMALESVSAPSKRNASADWAEVEDEDNYQVTIEAEYTIGEYDIVILSAEESDGLERWLLDNGYKIPTKASSVLKPYIRSDMKFFVVKVNLDNQKMMGFETLRPIQIEFESDKFMLPIRLGMANAEDFQDLIIYMFTERGRVETANYRTIKLRTDRNIPEFVVDDFGGFYTSLFDKAYEEEYRNAVFMEYAWDLGSNNFVKCDPCPVTPPSITDLHTAGVKWVSRNYQNNWGGSDYVGNVFMTRLHVRYDRSNFPQDLFFTETPSRENFQGRFIMTHAAKGVIDCEQALGYYKQVQNRRENEMEELAELTDWDLSDYNYYLKEYQVKIDKFNKRREMNKGGLGISIVMLILLSALSIRLERSSRKYN
ncbi:MAG: DUF2330 domain-containing protein [Chitinophagales bacterium]|nr:DUF2330 domain-containing protein [Chitinophagales bacterium]